MYPERWDGKLVELEVGESFLDMRRNPVTSTRSALTTGIGSKVMKMRGDFSARTPNSAKCSYGGGLDTRVNGYSVLLGFRKRVVYSSYT